MTRSSLFVSGLAVVAGSGWLAAGRRTLPAAGEAELRHAVGASVAAARHCRARRAGKTTSRRRRILALFEAVAARKVDDAA